MNTLEEERKFIKDLIIESGFSLREMSIKIGKKESYLHQYVKYGRPRKLADKDKEAIINMASRRKRKATIPLEELLRVFNDPSEISEFKEEANCYDKYLEKNFIDGEGICYFIRRDFLKYSQKENIITLKVIYRDNHPMFRTNEFLVCNCNINYYQGDGVYVIEEPGHYILRRVILDCAKNVLRIYSERDGSFLTEVEKSFRFYGRVSPL